MGSLIPRYEYDIFISYRQNDNKYDGWVTEFVANLNKELEATIKDKVTAYFDANPHDGLLETHDVNASLKDKLKCLIFIPIISRTYCDPKSFAWEHEFKVFVAQASKDQFGLKIRLPNGNTSSRVLPVLIHDLDQDDISLCESDLGGVLRGVDFIYKSAGVNRPLRSTEEKPQDNLNRTIYRDQINKVANAVKDIIQGLKADSFPVEKVSTTPKEPKENQKGKDDTERQKIPIKTNRIKLLILLIAFLIITVIVLTKVYKRDTLDKLRSSDERITVAIMPFTNMTNDTLFNVWQEGIQNILFSSMTNTPEIKVRHIEIINKLIRSRGVTSYASLTPSLESAISKKIDANVMIYGNINQAGPTIRLNAQLINSKNEEALRSFIVDGTSELILQTADSLSRMIQDFLMVSKYNEITATHLKGTTKSPEAYRYFIYGRKAFYEKDWANARDMFLQAISLDSNFMEAKINIPFTYELQGLRKDARESCLKVCESIQNYGKHNTLTIRHKVMVSFLHAYWFETPNEEIKYIKQWMDVDDSPELYTQLGIAYEKMRQWEKAVPNYEKDLEAYLNLNLKPPAAFNYTNLGWAYHMTGQYKKEEKLYKKAFEDFPDDPSLYFYQSILSISLGQNEQADDFMKKYVVLLKERMVSDAGINYSLGKIYRDAKLFDKAEEFFRQSVLLQPENPNRLYFLASLLIDTERNINEGLDLIEKAIKLAPEINSNNYLFLDTKGWGLYKQGRFNESLECLEKSWEQKDMYNHELFLHLEAAKKAVAGQKN